jgi:hypothetical protein
MVGLRYNHSFAGYEIFSDTGGLIQFGNIGFVDAYVGFNFHCIVQSGGTVKVTGYHNNTLFGTFTTPSPQNFDSLFVGAMDNTNSEPVDHWYKGVRLGTTAGGSDLLDADTFPATVVPPFDQVAGITFSTSLGELHVVNPGTSSNIYAKKTLQATVIPPNSALSDPGDTNIVFAGDSDWRMSSQPAWAIDAWGLDKLIVSVRGSRRTRDLFLATLFPWMPYPADPNMFLLDVTQEQRGTSNFPKIDLVFIGKRGGVLPPDKESQGEQVQQISGRSTFNPSHTLGLWFVSTTSEKTTYSRAPIDLSLVTPVQPANLDLIWLTETDVVMWAGSWETYRGIIETNVGYMFVESLSTTGNSETLVPGQYYRATRTTQRLLFPVLG